MHDALAPERAQARCARPSSSCPTNAYPPIYSAAHSWYIPTPALLVAKCVRSQRAIQLSGSPYSLPSQADGQLYYDQLVAANNCTAAPDTLDCLRGVPYDAFLATVNQTPDIFSYKGLSLVWSPHVDGDVIVQNLFVSVAQGAFAKVSSDCASSFILTGVR